MQSARYSDQRTGKEGRNSNSSTVVIAYRKASEQAEVKCEGEEGEGED